MALQIAIIMGAFCGVIMVAGSIYLLRSGAVTLMSASEKEALSIEVAEQVKISTSYPALGLFVIGLFFIIVSIYFGKPEYNELAIVGKLEADGPSNLSGIRVDYYIPIGNKSTDHNGKLEYTHVLKSPPEDIEAHVRATGYRNSSDKLTALIRDGDGWKLEYSLGEKVASPPPSGDLRIEEAPELPPIENDLVQ